MRPNIIWIITDQQHYETFIKDSPFYELPSVKKLRDEGTLFDRCYATNPVCGPARASFFSGLMPSENGVIENGLCMDKEIETLGMKLRKSGYDTKFIGKWHLHDANDYCIPGFDVLATGLNCEGNLSDTVITRAVEGFLLQEDRLHNTDGDIPFFKKIANSSEATNPFFLAICYQQPHDICGWKGVNPFPETPFRYPEMEEQLPPLPENFIYDPDEPGIIKKYRESKWPFKNEWDETHWRYYRWSNYRQCEMVDYEIGKVMETLKNSPYAENTWVFLTTDHGEASGEHQLVDKWQLYEGSVRTPVIVWRPGNVSAGAINSSLLSGVDFYNTFLELTGDVSNDSLTSISFLSLLEKQTLGHREYVVSESQNNEGRMVVNERYKYIYFKGDNKEQLFDLNVDPHETKNLAGIGEHSERIYSFRAILKNWEANRNFSSGVHPVTYNENIVNITK